MVSLAFVGRAFTTRLPVLFSVASLGWPMSGVCAQAGSTAVEPVFVRAQQMVTAGQDSAGRAVVDSVLAATTPGTPRYAEVLFWRATLSKTAAGAERDYQRIAVEYPISPRAAEALFRLSQLEMTRGDRVSARAHLDRLQREHPSSATGARASVVLARLAFDDGDLAAGCAAIASARNNLGAGDIELRNQVEYLSPRCANVVAATPLDSTGAAAPNAAPTGAGRRSADSTVTSRRATRPTPAAAQEYSVQVAAYDTRAAADALAKRLSDRGYAARVVGDQKPFRVRVGRYPTRERAGNAVRQMARQNVRGVIVEAEPR
jgi:cell division septation protein DedD